MVRFNVTPALNIDANQNVSGAVVAKYDHEGTQYSLRVNDSIRDGGNVLDHVRVGLKNDSMELNWDCGKNVGRLRMHGGLSIKDRKVNVKATSMFNSEGNQTYLNCTTDLDDDNTLRLILQAKGGQRPSHKDMILGYVHRQKDFEIEPRYNFSTESVSCGVTYKMDDENKLRAIFDVNSNEGSLQWTNSGGLGGDGDLRVTARATLDKDGMKQMPAVMIEKTWDCDM